LEWEEEALEDDGGGVKDLMESWKVGSGLLYRLVGMIVEDRLWRFGGGLSQGATCGGFGSGRRFSRCSRT
jgi:hypothetical protein